MAGEAAGEITDQKFSATTNRGGGWTASPLGGDSSLLDPHTSRAVTVDDQPWFLEADVASALGFNTTAGAGWYARHLKESERDTITLRDGNRGNPLKTIINEAGLYRLILRSDSSVARVFQS